MCWRGFLGFYFEWRLRSLWMMLVLWGVWGLWLGGFGGFWDLVLAETLWCDSLCVVGGFEYYVLVLGGLVVWFGIWFGVFGVVDFWGCCGLVAWVFGFGFRFLLGLVGLSFVRWCIF